LEEYSPTDKSIFQQIYHLRANITLGIVFKNNLLLNVYITIVIHFYRSSWLPPTYT